MDALLFIAKYGVLLCGILAVLCSASSQVRQLVLSFRHKNKFVQVLIFVWFVSLVVYGGSKPNADTDDSSQNSNQQEHSTQMPAGMVSTNINTQPQFMGGNVANTLNSTSQSQLTLPQWYIAKGYPIDDSDGDGIPDTWERWTHTKKLVNDALLDYDGDEVDNINEFMYMCDPHRRDTDGDGLDDKTEIDGMLAGIDGLNPISKANYIVTEVDSNYNGIPDLWDETSYHSFRDVNNDGFDDVYTNKMPPSSQYNFDVAVTISTTRTALLSSEYGSMLIAPCTNKVVKLRLSGDVDEGSISLSAFPDGANVSGLWKARMDISFLPKYGQICEKNRIKLEDGVLVDFEEMTVDYVGVVSSIQQRRHSNVNRVDIISIYYKPQYAKIITNTEDVCLEHGPVPQIRIVTNTESRPLLIKVNGLNEFYMYEDEIYLSDYLSSTDLLQTNLVIKIIDNPIYQIVNVNQEEEIALTKICHSSETNIVGAAWTSTHNPNDASDHEPGISESIEYFGQNCPLATNLTIRVGFSHDPQKVKTRNLPVIITNDPRDSNTDHCLGISYADKHNIEYDNFLDDKIKQFKDLLGFNVFYDYYSDNVTLIQPGSTFPGIFYVELRGVNNNIIYDTMWLVLYSKNDFDSFTNWRNNEQNRDPAWLQRLPAPYESLNELSHNSKYHNVEFPNGKWKATTEVDSTSYMHHNASYESRSVSVEGGHGHQATYDSNGNLIRNGIAAGSADFVSPEGMSGKQNHKRLDVVPFIQAVQIDGNPCYPKFVTIISSAIPTNFTRPCLYQGENLNLYFNYRPALPTGTTQNSGENK